MSTLNSYLTVTSDINNKLVVLYLLETFKLFQNAATKRAYKYLLWKFYAQVKGGSNSIWAKRNYTWKRNYKDFIRYFQMPVRNEYLRIKRQLNSILKPLIDAEILAGFVINEGASGGWVIVFCSDKRFIRDYIKISKIIKKNKTDTLEPVYTTPEDDVIQEEYTKDKDSLIKALKAGNHQLNKVYRSAYKKINREKNNPNKMGRGILQDKKVFDSCVVHELSKQGVNLSLVQGQVSSGS